MHTAPRPVNETERLGAPRALELLDTAPEQIFDDLVELARQAAGAPIALVSLIDDERQWFKGRVGIASCETLRDLAFCAHAMLTPDQVTWIEDARADPRFAAHPLVIGEPCIRFYAGAPLVVHAAAIGTVCVIDTAPHAYDAATARALAGLARLAVECITLAAAQRRAEAANLAKSVFLANMSHELRTPLNGIVGVIDLLAKEPLSPRQAELAELIRGSSRQLQHILGDVLDLARIEAGELTLADEPFNLAQAVKAAHDICAMRAREKGLALVSRIAAEADRPVLGDELRLKQVVINLLSNAVKFTAEGEVTLSVEVIGARVRIAVADTGIGFDAEQKATLFERFQQADGGITRRFGGAGLGLAISRELVEAMGGTITAEGAPGLGATFAVDLPLRIAERAPEAILRAAAETPVAVRALRALIADDHATNRRVLELMLSAAGAEVLSVENGAEAVERFRSARFDVVLMDMMMPVMDGLAATRELRRLERETAMTPTPVIMLTANAMAEHVREALAAGADLHLPKPVTPEALMLALDAALAGAADGAEGAVSVA
jgi:signal transduction histidine kinase/ActR/RegA family two-component response regulator